MRRTWRRRWLSTGAIPVVCSEVVQAHEIGGSRFDAPIPLSFLFLGAGMTVGLTALWLGVNEKQPAADGTHWGLVTVSPARATVLRTVARVGFLALVVVALIHGLIGKQVRAENAATVFVWPLWLEGVGLLAILAGSPWQALSPWRTLYTFVTWVEGDEIALLGEYPSWLSTWPAFLGFVLGVGVFENLTVLPRSPRLTVLLVTGYTFVMLLGGVAFGFAWFRYADTLAVLYRIFGRAAPFHFERTTDDGYRITARPPWRACTTPVRSLALVVFVVTTVYTISFDGFTGTPEFQTLLFGTRERLAVGPAVSVVLYLLGLGGFVGSFLLVSALVERRAVGARTGWKHAARAFAPTVIPITVTYEIAHNYPFVVRHVGQFFAIVTDLGSHAGGPSITLLAWMSLPLFWGSQVVLIVGGHVVAVVAAHLVAVRRYESLQAARRGHLPLVLLMVGYTVLSLWIVSRPVVSG